jgi:hypothetical protein
MRFFTDSIDVHAVTIMSDALYKDVLLSGNRVRALGAGEPVAGPTARLRGMD